MNKCLLTDVAEIRGRVGWKGYTVDDLVEEGPWVLGANDITSNNKIILDKAKHITRFKYEESPEIQLKKGDILVVKVGSTIGKVGIIDWDIQEGTINPNCVIVRPTKINPYYLYYWLSTPQSKYFLMNNSNASAQAAINQENLKKLPVYLVDIKLQEKIVSVLSCIDNKIALNNKTNTELENMAKTIYDYWFTQFDFPDKNGHPYKSSGGQMVYNEILKREIPARWKGGCFGDLIEIGNGKDHSKLDSGDIPVYGSGGLMRKVNKFLYSGESVLFPRKGTLNNVMYVNETFWTVDTMFYSIPKKQSLALYVYYNAKHFDFEKMNTGTGVPSMTSSIIKELPIIIPDTSILDSFDKTIQPIYQQVFSNRKENEELTKLRDYLLPLLMNGQIEVK